ncbi:membrane integrity-associated transporter subunit PqiC [Pseudoroseomonas globiformis]|uniref:Membrane integrity-associated transporter subunit PqiC n=1 Tax=Teichococcus globiformis TaxID=2307229 RepID=A0ABV7FX32_9PROT
MSLTRRHALLALPLLGAACASAEADYYRLEPADGPARQGTPRVIELRRVGLARYLDRSEIVRAGAPGRIELLPGARWAEPPGEMLGRVLAENLTRRLPGSTVFSEGAAITADSDAVAELEVQRFEDSGNGQVVLVAQAVVQPGTARASRRRQLNRTLDLEVPIQGSSTLATVQAMSLAAGRLADGLADMLAGARP